MLRHNKMVKWEFYYELFEDFLSYIDYDETNKHSEDVLTTGTSYKAHAVTRAFGKRYPACEICSMEESIMRKFVSNTNRNGI